MNRIACCALLSVLIACDGEEPPGPDPIPSLLPASYLSSFLEVRNCRTSSDHDLNKIRILADAQGAPAYTNRDVPFPEGAVVVKEERGMDDDGCSGPITQWTVMVKLATGTSSATLDWRWQKIKADGTVATQDEFRCINCHTFCGVGPEGYAGTCAAP